MSEYSTDQDIRLRALQHAERLVLQDNYNPSAEQLITEAKSIEKYIRDGLA
jgi:hypothetical protein